MTPPIYPNVNIRHTGSSGFNNDTFVFETIVKAKGVFVVVMGDFINSDCNSLREAQVRFTTHCNHVQKNFKIPEVKEVKDLHGVTLKIYYTSEELIQEYFNKLK